LARAALATAGAAVAVVLAGAAVGLARAGIPTAGAAAALIGAATGLAGAALNGTALAGAALARAGLIGAALAGRRLAEITLALETLGATSPAIGAAEPRMSTAWEDDGPATAALCNCLGTDAAGTNRTAGTRAREALQLVPNTAIAAFVLLLPASAVLAAALQLSSSPGVLLQLWTPRWAGAG